MSRAIPLLVVVVVLFCAAKFLHQHTILTEIIRELREAVTLKITYRSIDFFGFVAIFRLIVLCYLIHELRDILEMALYPYPVRAGSATVAGSRRTRLAPPGREPVFS